MRGARRLIVWREQDRVSFSSRVYTYDERTLDVLAIDGVPTMRPLRCDGIDAGAIEGPRTSPGRPFVMIAKVVAKT